MGWSAIARLNAVDPDEARDRARDIVDGLGPKDPPRPLRGLLEWIADGLRLLARPFARLFELLFEWLPDPVAWLLVALLALGAIWLVVRAARRRLVAKPEAASRPQGRGAEDHRDLEHAASEAEARGDHALAVRLRFRAGLLRLDREAHAIRYRPGLGNQDVRTALHQPRFDELADTFDRIAYGEAVADPDDSGDARRAWPEVVRAARRD